MDKHEEEIVKPATDRVVLAAEVDAAIKDRDSAESRRNTAQRRADEIDKQLTKTCGANLQERNVVVSGKIVQIKQDGVWIKNFIGAS